VKSLDDFRKPFQILKQKLTALTIPLQFQPHPIDLLLQLQNQAERFATQDEVTHALNRRGEEWFVPINKIRSVAKIDLYDMRQANRVYGVSAVDKELRRLSYSLKTLFEFDSGDYVRRSSGSDEFVVLSTNQTVLQLHRILKKFHSQDKFEALIPWDFGVGISEQEAEQKLQKSRKKLRPMVIRPIVVDNHSEIQRTYQYDSDVPSSEEFYRSYCDLIVCLHQLKLHSEVEQELFDSINLLQTHAESEITVDRMTGALNAIGRRWYLTPSQKFIKSVALTDMRDMHGGNLRYGSQAVDSDLQRFASVLLKEFRREDGFFVLRSAKAGDEFEVISCKVGFDELQRRFLQLHEQDAKDGLLPWNYGIGKDEIEAHNDLYKNIVQYKMNAPTELQQPTIPLSVNHNEVKSSTYYLVAKPEEQEYCQIYNLIKKIAETCGGSPIEDLHFTIQSVRDVSDITTLVNSIQECCSQLNSFEVKFTGVARMSAASIDRIWLLVENNPHITALYQNIAALSQKLNLKSYPYPVNEWKPHMKAVLLPNDTAPIKDNTLFKRAENLNFRLKNLELTRQVDENKWETVCNFTIAT
jgi:GGDEF domain-containing protein/2'-5' RNA ligase